jgi:hypothetical protein
VSGAVSLLAGLVLESGARWGEVATEWQWADARAILEPDDGDPLLHFDTRPRGGSKTSDLAGMTAAALVEQVPPGGRCYAIASDRDQARLLVDSLAGFVSRTPGLPGAIAVDRYSAVTPAGARLEVIPADAASSYGLRGSLFVVDELTQWPSVNREVWVSILSAVPKVPGARLVVLASAGDPAHWSYQIRERARVSPAWRLHEVPGPVPWVSESALLEQKALLTDSQYARLHLNRWTASEDRLVTIENLAAAVRLDGPQDPRRGVTYRIGVDLGLRNDRTAIAICHAEPAAGQVRTKRVVLDRMIVFAGTKVDEVKLAEVESVLIEAWKRYGRPRVRLDPWQPSTRCSVTDCWISTTTRTCSTNWRMSGSKRRSPVWCESNTTPAATRTDALRSASPPSLWWRSPSGVVASTYRRVASRRCLPSVSQARRLNPVFSSWGRKAKSRSRGPARHSSMGRSESHGAATRLRAATDDDH